MKKPFKIVKLKIMFSALAALIAGIIFAQTSTTTTSASVPAGSGPGIMLWIIIAAMAVLLFAVLMLGEVMIKLAKLIVEKGKGAKAASLLLLLLSSAATFAQDAVSSPKAPEVSSPPNWTMVIAVSVMVVITFVVMVMLFRIRLMLKEISVDEQVAANPSSHNSSDFLNVISVSRSIGREEEILPDSYLGGIWARAKMLPRQWVFGFYATLIFLFAYTGYYYLGTGPGSREAQISEAAQAKVAKDEYLRKIALNVDENTVTMADAAGMADGKTIFATNCSPCHGADGQGVVGPNLTDDYWVHGGSLNDIFKTIKLGSPTQGMKSWAADLTPVQIKNVASYIKSLHGTHPANAKAPQGDLYVEGNASKTIVTASLGDGSKK